MLSIDIYSRVPIFQQIVDGVRRDIAIGAVKEGEQMLSIRQMSYEIGVNPNTVSKAYTELERSGIISVAIGKGYFVTEGASNSIKSELFAERLKTLETVVTKLTADGMTEAELHTEITKIINSAKKEMENNQ